MSRHKGPLTIGVVLMMRYRAKRLENALLTDTDNNTLRRLRMEYTDTVNPDLVIALIDSWLSRNMNGNGK